MPIAKIGASWFSSLFKAGHLAQAYAQTHGRRVDEVMTRDVVVVAPNQRLEEAVLLMEQHGIKRLPVVENERVVGLLSALSGRNEAETAALEILASWDFRLAADSPGAALYEVWWANHLHAAIIADAVGKPELRPLFAPGDTAGILDRLEAIAAETPGAFAALALGSLALLGGARAPLRRYLRSRYSSRAMLTATAIDATFALLAFGPPGAILVAFYPAGALLFDLLAENRRMALPEAA